MADVYLHGHHASVLASHGARTAADSAAYLLPRLRDGMRVLDVGCGPGTITLDLAEAVAPTGAVTGIENVEGPLEHARATPPHAVTSAREFDPRPTSGSFRMPDDSFDVVHAHQVLQHLTDPVGALREMARVRVPAVWSPCATSTTPSMVWHPASEGMTRWLEVYRRLARLNHAEPDAGRHLVAWAHAAGLTRLEPSASLWTYATPEQCAWWGRHLGPPRARVDLRDAGARARARDARRPGGHQRRLAGVVDAPRRVVRDDPRRGDRPRLTPVRSVRSVAAWRRVAGPVASGRETVREVRREFARVAPCRAPPAPSPWSPTPPRRRRASRPSWSVSRRRSASSRA